MDLSKIIGKTNLARLQKAGLAEASKLRRLTPEQAMSLAGIGPKTAQKLYAALGKTAPLQTLTRTYKKLPLRTRFSRIKAAAARALKNPQGSLEKAERARELGHGLQNVAAGLYNFGRDDAERVRPVEYRPLDTSISPFERFSGQGVAFGEITVTTEDRRHRIELSRTDTRTGENEGETVEYANTPGETQARIEELVSAFRADSKARLIIILDDDTVSIMSALEKKYAKELAAQTLIIEKDADSYLDWSVMLKYSENAELANIARRFDALKRYLEYAEDQRESRATKSFADYDDPREYWKELEARQVAKYTVAYKGFKLSLEPVNASGDPVEAPYYEAWRGWEEFKAIAKSQHIKIGGVSIPLELHIAAQQSIGPHTLHIQGKKLTYQSTSLKDIGITIERD